MGGSSGPSTPHIETSRLSMDGTRQSNNSSALKLINYDSLSQVINQLMNTVKQQNEEIASLKITVQVQFQLYLNTRINCNSINIQLVCCYRK